MIVRVSKLEIFGLLFVVVLWAAHYYQKAGTDGVKTYHFKGEFCGVELWEYSARGDALAIWTEWVTNYPHVHVVLRTNRIENWLKQR